MSRTRSETGMNTASLIRKHTCFWNKSSDIRMMYHRGKIKGSISVLQSLKKMTMRMMKEMLSSPVRSYNYLFLFLKVMYSM